MARRYPTFADFYPDYLSQHSNRACRRLHFVGTSLGLMLFLIALWTTNFRWVLAALLAGYGLAWAGHFFFEGNRPATLRNPFYSFLADWVMWSQMLRGRIPF